jgi:hypothetical protein
MKFSIAASALVALASSVSAVTQGCVTMAQANKLVARWSSMITKTGSDLGDLSTTANAILVKDFKVYSDSILSLEQLPVSASPEYSSLTARNSLVVQLLPAGTHTSPV